MKRDIEDRVKAAYDTLRLHPVVQTIEAYRTPPLDWKAVGVIILTIVTAFFLGRCGAEKERDKWWRDAIAKSSQAVEDVLNKERPAIDDLDKAILEALRDSDEKRKKAEDELKKAKSAPPRDGCPRIPAVCLRER